MTAKVEIYSKNYCPYCVRAKNLLEIKGVPFTEYNIEQDAARFEEMLKRAPGSRTVPQIFIDDALVGGFDDMAALDAQGKLDGMLA